MGNLSGFDARQVEPNTGFDPLPEGKYEAAIIESAMKPTKNGDGKLLELKMQVASGQYKGRYLFDRLNLVNKNQQAVEIAKASLSSICRAVGVLTPNDSSELHGKKFIVKVKIRDGQYNDVKGYEAVPKTAAHATQAFGETPTDYVGEKKNPFGVEPVAVPNDKKTPF